MTVQSLNYTVAGTSTAAGVISFTFPAIPISQTWTGTIIVPGSPDTANFSAVVGATSVGEWKAGNTWGPVQLPANNQLVVNGV